MCRHMPSSTTSQLQCQRWALSLSQPLLLAGLQLQIFTGGQASILGQISRDFTAAKRQPHKTCLTGVIDHMLRVVCRSSLSRIFRDRDMGSVQQQRFVIV